MSIFHLQVTARPSATIRCPLPVAKWLSCVSAENTVLEAESVRLFKAAVDGLSKADLSESDRARAKADLLRAQRAWLNYRNLDCKSVFTVNGGGDASKQEDALCMQTHLERRIGDLKKVIGAE